MKVLARAFLVLIGVTLLGDGVDHHRPSASGPDRIGTAEHVQKVNAACSRTACRSPNRDEEYGPGLHSLTKATNMNLKSKGIEIYDLWTSVWNLNLDLAAKILSPQLTLHYAQAGGELFDDIHRPEQLAEIIKAWHKKRSGLVFASDGEAVVDLAEVNGEIVGLVARPYLVCYGGEDGTTVRRSGTDILKISNGRITEVWSVSSGAQGRTFYPTRSTVG
jgi:hypothetical protein